MIDESKAQRIVEWRENLAILPDEAFFEIIRAYLGEVKTPYNKTKLIESLGGFLRKDENKKSLLSLLTEDDLIIISAVHFMNDPTKNKLATFFSSKYSVAIFFERLSNLQERLILYTHKKSKDSKEIISINPMLEDELLKFVSMEFLLPETEIAVKESMIPSCISPEYLASFASYILATPDLCKGDGSFKKRIYQELNGIYGISGGENASRLLLLIKAFFNLNLFHYDDKTVSPDWERIYAFADLNAASQLSYCIVSGAARFSRKTLVSHAQLFLDTICSIPECGYTRDNILRLSILVKEHSGGAEVFQQSRFSEILSRAQGLSSDEASEGASDSGMDSGLMDYFLDNAIEFGVIYKSGIASDYLPVYSLSPSFAQYRNIRFGTADAKVLSIDSGFAITIMPGLSFKKLLPLMKFLSPVKYDTAALFEINRQSCMRAFDMNITPEKIFESLTAYSYYELPQNMCISVEEWFASYNSAVLYKGYVLKVSEENLSFVEKNPVLQHHIREVLAPGVFLLSVTTDEEAKVILSKCGLDFVGDIRSVKKETPIMPFQALNISSRNLLCVQDHTATQFRTAMVEQKKYLASLREVLDGMEMTEDQRDGLEERIARRVVVNETQLRPTSVRSECLEALGIDHTGKIHVIESAIATGSMLEVEVEDKQELLVGTPVIINKRAGNADFVLRLEPFYEKMTISVSSAVRIKKIRTHFTLQ